MNKDKLAFMSFSLLVLGVLIGYSIGKYNQSRYVIHNNQENERVIVGYSSAYPQPDKEDITSILNAKEISIDSNRNSSIYQYMQYVTYMCYVQTGSMYMYMYVYYTCQT